ncbi:MAG: ECs_2282 family putative zinc-binding protein [Lachnospiraceae bacterium]
MKDINKKISLLCNTCGNDQFSTIYETIEDMENALDDTEIKCSDCGKVLTKIQLVEENEYLINANIEDLKKEALNKLEKELKKIFK